ncbi:MAG: chromate transporter [Burkholderiaceae bacterium]|nr:chromate transporter [Burkholderiaceae bacterium]
MNSTVLLSLNWQDWLGLFLHTAMLSLLSVGGGITIMPALHQYIVEQHAWLTDAQFNASIVIAQAAPGPNVLMIAIFGWSIGLQTGSMLNGLIGVAAIMTGMMLPTATLTYYASRWLQANRERQSVRAFRQGMIPIVSALLVASAWIIAASHNDVAKDWPLWVVSGTVMLLVWRTRLHLLWMLAAGALLGWLGLI